MGDGAVLEGIDGGVDTADTMKSTQASQQSQATIGLTAVTPVIQMDALSPKYLLQKTKALLTGRQLGLSQTIPDSVVVQGKPSGGPQEHVVTLPLNQPFPPSGPTPGQEVPNQEANGPQESQTPGTSDNAPGIRVKSIREAQLAIPHLRDCDVVTDGKYYYFLVIFSQRLKLQTL